MIDPYIIRVHWIIWSEPHSGWSRIYVEHYALPGQASRRDSYPSLSTTQTIIYCFNANGTRPMGKIKNLKSEVTLYVIDANTSYNLLLGWP